MCVSKIYYNLIEKRLNLIKDGQYGFVTAALLLRIAVVADGGHLNKCLLLSTLASTIYATTIRQYFQQR